MPRLSEIGDRIREELGGETPVLDQERGGEVVEELAVQAPRSVEEVLREARDNNGRGLGGFDIPAGSVMA